MFRIHTLYSVLSNQLDKSYFSWLWLCSGHHVVVKVVWKTMFIPCPPYILLIADFYLSLLWLVLRFITINHKTSTRHKDGTTNYTFHGGLHGKFIVLFYVTSKLSLQNICLSQNKYSWKFQLYFEVIHAVLSLGVHVILEYLFQPGYDSYDQLDVKLMYKAFRRMKPAQNAH